MSIKINHRLRRLDPSLKDRKVYPLGLKPQITQIFLLVTSYWLLVTSCYAAPCYGTKMPKKKEFFTGAQTHSIFKRYLEDEFGKLRSTQYFINLSYGVCDWFSIDLKGGLGNIKQHPVSSDEVDYASNFAGGYGLRLKFYDKENIKMVFGFQHISVHAKSTHLGDTKNQAILDDWQTSMLASYDFKKFTPLESAVPQEKPFLTGFTPYMGARWSRIDYIHKEAGTRKRKMSDLTKSFGAILGCDFCVTEKFWFNLEGQFFDGEALGVSVNYSF